MVQHRTGIARLIAAFAIASLTLAACSSAATPSPAPPTAAPTTAPATAPASAAATPAPTASAAAAATCTGAGDKGTVKLMINQWVGAQANVAVVQCLLAQMGYDVKTDTLAEEVAWQGFDTGDVDVILENWGHPDLEKTYITDKKVAQNAGPNGIIGLIHWYIPPWLATQYPDITDWNNLNKYADQFKTSESKGKGQFLASDPTFVQEDRAIIKNLNLNFTVVDSGSEAASIAAFKQAEAQKTFLIGYFYDPQWLLRGDPARPGQTAAIQRRVLRRLLGSGPGEDRLRLPGVHAEQGGLHEVRGVRRRCLHRGQELQVEELGPERGRRLDHEQEHDA